MQPRFRDVAVLDLLLNRENPRHEPKSDQEEIIKYLLEDEEVYNLARHMSAHGLNPLEIAAVFPDEEGNLVVAEGNRRLCAAQLLSDPEKAPEGDRAKFRALRDKGVDVSRATVMEFPDYETAQPWLQVLHDGEQDGVGRRRWKPAQKARATTSASKDALAVALTDYAERKGIFDQQSREKMRISTVTRYLANPKVRRAMALDSTPTSEKVVITTDVDRFDEILSDFFAGVASRRLHSRSTKLEWEAYADELTSRFDAVSAPTGPVDVTERAPAAAATKAKATKVRIVAPETRFIQRSAGVVGALNDLQSFKLSSLYKSLVVLRLDEHPVLAYTGAWVFVEVLTALHGRTSAEFMGYINAQFRRWGISKDEGKEINLSLDAIQKHGNAHKHSATFSAVGAQDLSIHFRILDGIFVHLLTECAVQGDGE